MRVVSNTSPVCNLAVIGRLELLRRKFGKVVIPEAVARELSALDHPDGRASIESALQAGWLTVEPVADRRLLPVLRSRIDEGEAEAIELARQSHANLLILDDLDARRIAGERVCPIQACWACLSRTGWQGISSLWKAKSDV